MLFSLQGINFVDLHVNLCKSCQSEFSVQHLRHSTTHGRAYAAVLACAACLVDWKAGSSQIFFTACMTSLCFQSFLIDQAVIKKHL